MSTPARRGASAPHALSHEGRELLRAAMERDPLIVLDFDGTLAPLVRDPRRARMRKATASLLERLAARRPVAILSGRSLADLADRMPVDVAALVGSHGAEGLPGSRGRAPDARLMDRWARAIERRMDGWPGVWVENKTHCLAVHFRNSPQPREARRELLSAARALRGARLRLGERVLDVLAPDQPDKGEAVRRLLDESGLESAIVVGDDATDEDAFRLGRGRVTSVRVGRSDRTGAGLVVLNQKEVDALLRLLAEQPTAGERRRRASLPVTLEVLQLLWGADHALRSASKSMERRLDLSGPQRLALRVIEETPGLTPGELAAALRRDPSTLTPLLAGLEKRRLLRRRKDPLDARRSFLEITVKGLAARGEGPGTIEEAVARALRSLDDETLASGRRFLRAVTAELEKIEDVRSRRPKGEKPRTRR